MWNKTHVLGKNYLVRCKVLWIWAVSSITNYQWLAAAAKLLQLCLTLCDPRDGSPPGFLVPGILQARTLEWVAISFSNAWKWKVKVKSLSRVRFLATPWTAAYQAPPSMGFSRQEYWSGVPLPSPRTCFGLVSISCLFEWIHVTFAPENHFRERGIKELALWLFISWPAS